MAAIGVVEMTAMSNERALLQDAADAGALAGAGKLTIATYAGNTDSIKSTAVTSAMRQLDGLPKNTRATFTADVDLKTGIVTVNGIGDREPLFGFMGLGEAEIKVVAVAENLQKVPLCILQTTGKALNLKDTARIRAPGCAIHANGDIDIAASAMIETERLQASGTVTGISRPMGNAGAMAIADPFADMDLAPPLPCLVKVLKIKVLSEGFLYLPPGIHCEDYKVEKNAKLVLLPGDHYFMGGLQLKNDSIIEGEDVVLIFDKDKSFSFADKGTVRISARKSGKFAGFLVITTRDNDATFSIKSDRVSELMGTIYIPNATLEIETAGNVAEDSAWSVIVAHELILRKDPVLVINNRYVGSGVPVPEGVGPNRNAPVLKQ